MIAVVSQVIRVRDVVHGEVYDLGPDEPIFRAPYDLIRPMGEVVLRGSLADWSQAGTPRSGRVSPDALGSVHPGERVLLQLPPGSKGAWWLCEIEAVDGIAGS